MKSVTVAKFELVLTRYWQNFEEVEILPRFCEIMSFISKALNVVPFFHRFRVFTRCRFQHVPVRLPFSISTVFKICRQKNVLLLCEREPYLSHFQNVSASYERSLFIILVIISHFLKLNSSWQPSSSSSTIIISENYRPSIPKRKHHLSMKHIFSMK